MISRESTPLSMLASQRSHLLIVLSRSKTGHASAYHEWYRAAFRSAFAHNPEVLSVRQYRQHEFDITAGRWPRLPFQYLALLEISIDGAEAAMPLIEGIRQAHSEEPSAQEPATWLYYPVSEKVGRTAKNSSSLLTVAFANGLAGQEGAFREWYATRHIRHALNIEALVSGQCFERTQFQRPGAHEAAFATIAIYEQEGSPEAMQKCLYAVPAGTLDFPMMDLNGPRFSESVYRPV